MKETNFSLSDKYYEIENELLKNGLKFIKAQKETNDFCFVVEIYNNDESRIELITRTNQVNLYIHFCNSTCKFTLKNLHEVREPFISDVIRRFNQTGPEKFFINECGYICAVLEKENPTVEEVIKTVLYYKSLFENNGLLVNKCYNL